MLGSVEHAVCKDESRFHLNGVLFEYDGLRMRFVATDGHRLVKREREVAPFTAQGAEPFRLKAGVIIPAAGVKQIRKLLATGECSIGQLGHFLVVRFQNVTLAIKLIDAQFPPYEQVIPKEHKKIITVDRLRFIDALRRAQLMSSETRGVKVAASKDGMTITSDNPDLGEVREELEAEYNAEPIAIGFNPKYVVELLTQMSSDQITIALGGELDPGLIRPLTGDDYLGVVMPMRI
jgi:DNA polymerase-3 subunit beta